MKSVRKKKALKCIQSICLLGGLEFVKNVIISLTVVREEIGVGRVNKRNPRPGENYYAEPKPWSARAKLNNQASTHRMHCPNCGAELILSALSNVPASTSLHLIEHNPLSNTPNA